jgi:hypothetical protein
MGYALYERNRVATLADMTGNVVDMTGSLHRATGSVKTAFRLQGEGRGGRGGMVHVFNVGLYEPDVFATSEDAYGET